MYQTVCHNIPESKYSWSLPEKLKPCIVACIHSDMFSKNIKVIAGIIEVIEGFIYIYYKCM
jgi:hypothetical protein